IPGRAVSDELSEGGLGFVMLTFIGEPGGGIIGGARLSGPADLPVVVAAPRRDCGDHQDDRSHDIVAVTVPQLLELFPAYFLVDFGENIRHETSPPFGALPRYLSHRQICRVSHAKTAPARIAQRT